MNKLPEIGSRWRHKKTGGVYTVIQTCLIEATLEPAVVYGGERGYYRDGVTWKYWLRPAAEFMDGRFEIVLPPDAGKGCVEPHGTLCRECAPFNACMAI